MIDALQPVLFMNGFETERIFFDKFTTSAGATPAH
jgi:propane monooxygenase reductase subunit